MNSTAYPISYHSTAFILSLPVPVPVLFCFHSTLVGRCRNRIDMAGLLGNLQGVLGGAKSSVTSAASAVDTDGMSSNARYQSSHDRLLLGLPY